LLCKSSQDPRIDQHPETMVDGKKTHKTHMTHMTGTIEHGCWRWMEDGMIPMFPSQRATSSAGDDGSWKSVWALIQLSCDVVLGTYDTLWVGQWQFTIASYFAMNHNEHQGLWQIYIYVYIYVYMYLYFELERSQARHRGLDTQQWQQDQSESSLAII
jgi:hypothetical protein